MKTQFIVCVAFTLLSVTLTAQSTGYDPDALNEAGETMVAFMEKDSKFEKYFEEAYSYIIFPSVGKGGYVVGGARGSGIVYEEGTPIGKAMLTQITLGFQFGGQAYSQVIFFETEKDLERFRQNKLELAAEASAVAVTAGSGASLNYRNGVAVFTKSKAGFMYEAALGGQKLKFKPYEVVN